MQDSGIIIQTFYFVAGDAFRMRAPAIFIFRNLIYKKEGP